MPGSFLADGAAASPADRGHSLRQSTRYNVTFSASGKFQLYLGFSSPHKGRSPLRGPYFDSATGGGRVAPYLLRYAQSVSNEVMIRRPLMQVHQGRKKSRYPIGYLLFMAPLAGLEPATCGLTVRRSTD